jgi:HAT1-interacting factor 1
MSPNSQVSQTGNPRIGRRVFRVNLLYLRVISEPAVKDEAKGRFFFGADGEEDPAVDLFAQAQAAEQEEAPEKEEADENEDPEDDFEASWDILDLARSTYDTMQGDESQLKLAATYMALGDISLETGVPYLFY